MYCIFGQDNDLKKNQEITKNHEQKLLNDKK